MNDGTTIKGEFNEGEFINTAKITYPDGSIYEGGFDNGEKNGLGVLEGPYSKYSGNWLDNKFYGTGELIDKTLDRRIKGEWKYGKIDGFAKIFGPCDALEYQGRFKQGKKNGKGEATTTWLHYAGEWVNDQMDGIGKLSNLKSGVSYEGKFENGVQVSRI